jgi:hypothetical protein
MTEQVCMMTIILLYMAPYNLIKFIDGVDETTASIFKEKE